MIADRIARAVAANPGGSVTEIAEAAGCDAADLWSVVGVLEATGRIRREGGTGEPWRFYPGAAS